MDTTRETASSLDDATIDHYVAKGRRERSRAVADMIRAIFSAPEDQNTPAKGVSVA